MSGVRGRLEAALRLAELAYYVAMFLFLLAAAVPAARLLWLLGDLVLLAHR